MASPTEIPNIRIITVSGRIASGSTTLAEHLAQKLNWRHLEGGEIFWEAVRKKMGLAEKDTNLRPDEEDKLFDARLRDILKEEKHIVLETKLAAFNAQGIDGIFKILVLCERAGVDQPQIRIDRLINRDNIGVEEAKEEVLHREMSDIEKWRRLYANNDPNWVYWEGKYYDLAINTYDKNSEQTFQTALTALGTS
ncbi:MAG: AAA family ATPase [Candidatus Levybacteria bacterium]|nr:AAA family ATPase [Candidatus Levybacteria bacterium]